MDTLDASKDSLAGKVKKSQSGIDRHSHVLLSMGTTLENIGLILRLTPVILLVRWILQGLILPTLILKLFSLK